MIHLFCCCKKTTNVAGAVLVKPNVGSNFVLSTSGSSKDFEDLWITESGLENIPGMEKQQDGSFTWNNGPKDNLNLKPTEGKVINNWILFPRVQNVIDGGIKHATLNPLIHLALFIGSFYINMDVDYEEL